ncbi:hypothetical protein KH5H1_40960 [Corallococcus caeni]|nr:hypothetical protein KH5H1_40960 [Corallococcus sp. KH5-1]
MLPVPMTNPPVLALTRWGTVEGLHQEPGDSGCGEGDVVFPGGGHPSAPVGRIDQTRPAAVNAPRNGPRVARERVLEGRQARRGRRPGGAARALIPSGAVGWFHRAGGQ